MIHSHLKFAIEWRRKLNLFEQTEALRVFYGPGESTHPELKQIAIDLFKDHLWITTWKSVSESFLLEVAKILPVILNLKIEAIVVMDRSTVESSATVRTLLGSARIGRYSVNEFGIQYLVQMENTKHPGLFLDHAPLRQWLKTTQKNCSVLNLFAYTGSLSVAAGVGGAEKVVTLDLSKPTIEWAKENWANQKLAPEKADFIFGDALEWLPKMKKRGDQFDTILCDPPSFSRSKNGTFSTNKDSGTLHEHIFPLLKKGGILVTSINSENYSEGKFMKDIEAAAQKTGTQFRTLRTIDLPESFPTSPDLQERYLKGFYLIKNQTVNFPPETFSLPSSR